MKKLIVTTLICGLVLTGCGSGNTKSSTAPTDISIEQNTATSVEKNTEKPTDELIKETTSEVDIAEQVLYDQDGIKITAKGLSQDGFMGPSVKLLLENDSDKNITVQTRNSSVNGYMMDLQMSADVAVGKKANNEMDIYKTALKQAGVDVIAELEFSFHIFETASWETITDSEQIILKTNIADGYVQTYDDSGDILYNNDGIKIISKGLSVDESFMGPELMLYIENSSSKNVTIQARDTSVNGFMTDPTISCEVASGKKAVHGMSFFKSTLEENGITEIEEIETSFHIFESAGWDTIVDSEPITISFK